MLKIKEKFMKIYNSFLRGKQYLLLLIGYKQ